MAEIDSLRLSYLRIIAIRAKCTTERRPLIPVLRVRYVLTDRLGKIVSVLLRVPVNYSPFARDSLLRSIYRRSISIIGGRVLRRYI